MSDRREFLKQAGALAAIPWPQTPAAIPHRDAAKTPPAKLEWEVTDGEIHITQGTRRLLSGLCAGVHANSEWQPGVGLTVLQTDIAQTDRLGSGKAILTSCSLGPIKGKLLLVNYSDGRIGCRLGLTNDSSAPIVLQSYSPLMTHPETGTVNLTGHPAEWRVYIDSGGCGGKCASYGLTENEGRNAAGAVSLLWSPTGNESLAIGQVEVERSWTSVVYEFGEHSKSMGPSSYHWAQAKNLRLRLEQDAIGYQLDPGETLDLDLCLLLFDPDPFAALSRFADAMVTYNRVRTFTNKDTWVGWMTWYNQEAHLRGGFGATGDTSATAAITLEQCRFIVDSHLDRYGVRDVEIDDGYQKNIHLGDWLETTPMFPTGMGGLASDMKKLGMIPGIWLAPFVATEDSQVYRDHPQWFVRYAFDWYHANLPVRAWEFDPTAPGALDWLLNVFHTFQGWGYWFFKNDFSGGLISSNGKQYYNRKQTGLMRWRWAWRKIKEALGGDGKCSIQFCGANNIGGIGIVDSVRTGSDVVPCVSDSAWKIIREDTATTGINRWWQNKRFFISDPDNLEVAEYKNYRLYRDTLDFASKWALSFDEARVRAALVIAIGGNIVLGDRLTLLEPERIAIIKKTLPLYGESAIPLDMFEQTVPCLWWHHVSKPWGTWEVLSVVNYGEASLVKDVPLSKMGLRYDQPLVAWEFWSQQEHGNLHDGLLRVVVPPHSVKTLRLTTIEPNRSTLVGTSYHMIMGALEVSDVRSDAGSRTQLRIARPASEEGSYAFWSAQQQRVVLKPLTVGPEGVTVDLV